jgi:GNAT superfamily N-acetyltransferase
VTATLLFEYFAETQAEAGRPVPATIDDLPPVLRAECLDLPARFTAFLVAYVDGVPAGCVGLRARGESLEVKRLYVRPAHRRTGLARRLMADARRYAAQHGYGWLILDVMPSRIHVIAFYRGLGFASYEPDARDPRFPMVYMRSLARIPVVG